MNRTRYSFLAIALVALLLLGFASPAFVGAAETDKQTAQQQTEQATPAEATTTAQTPTSETTAEESPAAESPQQVQPEATATMPPVPVATMAPTDPKQMPKPSEQVIDEVIVILSEGIALFEKPSTESPVLAHFEVSSAIPLVRAGQAWTEVPYGEGGAFIPTYALRFGYGSPQPVLALVTAPGGKLTLRAEMSTKSKALDSIPSGRAVLLLAKSNPFSLVRFEGREGYVLTQHIMEITPSQDLGLYTQVVSLRETREANVRIRSHPSRQGVAYATVKSGQSVVVLEIKDGWAKVEYEGIHGYMMEDYLKRYE